MKLTNREMISYLNNLIALKESRENLGGEINYKVSRNKNKLMKEYESFDKARVEAKKSFCELDEQGNIKQETKKIEDENGKEHEIKNDIFLEGKEKEWQEAEKKMLDEDTCEIDIRMVKEQVVFDSNASAIATELLLFMIEDETETKAKEESK